MDMHAIYEIRTRNIIPFQNVNVPIQPTATGQNELDDTFSLAPSAQVYNDIAIHVCLMIWTE